MHGFTFKVKRQRIKCMSKYPDFPSIPIATFSSTSDCDLDQNKMLIYKKNKTSKSVI